MQNYKIWFVGDTEYVSFDSWGFDSAAGTEKMYPFLENLLRFSELDITTVEPIIHDASKHLERYLETGEREHLDHAMVSLGKLGEEHVYFKLEYLRWFCRHMTEAITMEMVNELRQFSEQLTNYQKQIQSYFYHVMDFELVGRETQKNARANSNIFPFRAIQVSFEPVDADTCGNVLYPDTIRDIIDFTFRECVTRGIPVRRCKNCGRYFPLLGRITAEYCSRPNEKRKACRDAGAAMMWTKSQTENLGFREYRREYKRRFSWRKAGKITELEFAAWSKQARAKKDEYEAQKITLDELKMWMRNS